MENLLHLANQIYMQYISVIMIALLACILILMIAALGAVRKNRKQIKQLAERTKELTKVALSQSGQQGTYARKNMIGNTEQKDMADGKKQNGQDAGKSMGVSREDEELFGAMIQEIFP